MSPDFPYPPLKLANRVGSLRRWDDPYKAYKAMGARARLALLDLLPDGWSFEGKRVLDFGCGAGRTLRHFIVEAETGEFWGTDIDAASIDWLQEAFCPPLHAVRCNTDPPLPLDSGSFDLIWAISVFTHLTDNSIPWLLELHRLLKPDGLLIATYIGPRHSQKHADEPWDEDRVGMNVLRSGNPWDRGGPTVLMSDWWVRDHWGRAFEVLQTKPDHQTWVLLRKRDVELTADDLERPGDDPREWAALRHNLRQVWREQSEMQRDYGESLSWRVTRPLRAAGQFARSLRSR
ncbi:MAG: class I SAM-dependent methyltransferase [Solirubrobacterales bacterium]